MNRRHVSIRTLALIVALIATNCGYLRFQIFSGGRGAFVWVGDLTLFNLLLVIAYRLLVHRRARRPFPIGFTVVGLAGLVLSPPLLERWHDPIGQFVMRTGEAIPFIESCMTESKPGPALSFHQRAIAAVFVIVVLNAVISLPLLLAASLGGALSSLIHRGIPRIGHRPEPTDVG